MKKRVLNLILWLSVLSQTYAQKISSHITLQNGREVSKEYAFLENDVCTFHVDDVLTEESAKWAFAVFNGETNSFMIKVWQEESSKDFIVSADMVERNVWHSEAKRFEYEGDSSRYFKGCIYLFINEEKKDSMIVLFNLLPSKPKVIDASFTYTRYDWDYDDFYPDYATFNIIFFSARCTKLIVETGDPFFFEFPHDKRLYFNIKDIVFPSFENYYLTADVDKFADWGQYYRFIAQNDYGNSYVSDTIVTTDYITDPAILARLEEIRQEVSSISDISKDEDIHIFSKHDYIEVQGNKFLVSNLTLFDMNGKIVRQQKNGEDMNISDLPKGLYIISCQTKMHQKLIFKVIKS